MRPYSRNNERGVIIPLLAVISLALFVVLSVLGIDSAAVQYRSADLKALANEACKDLPDTAMFPGKAARIFANRVNTIAGAMPSGLTLVTARLILPTMPKDFALAHSFTQLGQQTNHTTADDSPFYTGGNPSFDICTYPSVAATGEPACLSGTFCGVANRCIFQADAYFSITETPPPPAPLPNPSMLDKYPVSMIHNLPHGGNTVLCELVATLATTMSGTRAVRGTSGWRLPAAGFLPAPAAPLPSTFTYPTYLPEPGLSVAVAPHMTTYRQTSLAGADNRFEFTGYNPTSFWDNFDPLAPLLLPPAIPAFQSTSVSHNLPGWSTQPMSHNIDSSIFTAAQLLDLLNACMNPAILVRNTLLSGILEMASRHGQFRNMTEFLLVGTQHRNVATVNSIHVVSNYPTIITPFLSDIAAQTYQIPYIFYFGGTQPSVVPGTSNLPHPSFGPALAVGSTVAQPGFLSTFNDVPVATQNNHALLSNQMRFCYHLFGSAGNTLRRFPQNLITDDAQLTGFEDPTRYGSGIANPPSLRQIDYTSGQRWDQGCPWDSFNNSSSSPVCGEPSSGGQTRNLSAAEVAASLGSIQSCPAEQFNYQVPDSGGINTICSKAAFINDNNSTYQLPASFADAATLDLRPDLVGLMRYVRAAGPETITPGCPNDLFPAIWPPGIFPVATGAGGCGSATFAHGLADLRYPFSAAGPIGSAPFYYKPNLSQAKLASAPLLLVTHQRLNTARNCNTVHPTNPSGCNCAAVALTDEVCRLRCLVNGFQPSALQSRPITVVYIPTTRADIGPNDGSFNDPVFNLQCAFNASLGSAPLNANSLFVLSPYFIDPAVAASVYSTAGCGGSPNWDTPCHIQAYWRWLLTLPTTSPFSLVSEVNRIFTSRLAVKRLFN